MKIKKITSQHRRDFTAILECEYCSNEQQLTSGYDDLNYHNNVIPTIKCTKCGKMKHESYRPLQPKYSEYETI